MILTSPSLARMALLGALGLSCLSATAAMPPTTQVAGSELKLNGEGIRYKAIFKVYEMALYTTAPATTAEQLLAAPGPKKLAFVALRELPGTDLGLNFIQGLSANNSKELTQRHVTSTNRLIEIFSGKPKLLPGDTFAMEFIPGKGTQFYIGSVAQGAPVGNEEFFGMILRIWVGPSPADNLLKGKLLGQ